MASMDMAMMMVSKDIDIGMRSAWSQPQCLNGERHNIEDDRADQDCR